MQHFVHDASIGRLLDHVVDVLRSVGWRLAGLVGIVWLPPFLCLRFLETFVTAGDATHLLNQLSHLSAAGELRGFVGFIVVWIGFSLVAAPLAIAALIHSVAETLSGREARASASLAIVCQRAFPILAANLLFSAAVTAGMLLCVIPGAFVYCVFRFVPHEIVVERRGVLDAWRRSMELTRGRLVHIFVLLLLLIPMQLGLEWTCRLIRVPTVVITLTSIGTGLFVMVTEVSFVVLYFACRARFENHDLRLLADAVAAQDTSP